MDGACTVALGVCLCDGLVAEGARLGVWRDARFGGAYFSASHVRGRGRHALGICQANGCRCHAGSGVLRRHGGSGSVVGLVLAQQGALFTAQVRVQYVLPVSARVGPITRYDCHLRVAAKRRCCVEVLSLLPREVDAAGDHMSDINTRLMRR